MGVKRVIKIKRYVFINLKLLANSFNQVMSDPDKQRHFLIFMRH